MKKKFLSILTGVALALSLLPAAALAAETPEVYVGGVGLVSGQYLDCAGNITTEQPEGGYASYEDGELTLVDNDYEGPGWEYPYEHENSDDDMVGGHRHRPYLFRGPSAHQRPGGKHPGEHFGGRRYRLRR